MWIISHKRDTIHCKKNPQNVIIQLRRKVSHFCFPLNYFCLDCRMYCMHLLSVYIHGHPALFLTADHREKKMTARQNMVSRATCPRCSGPGPVSPWWAAGGMLRPASLSQHFREHIPTSRYPRALRKDQTPPKTLGGLLAKHLQHSQSQSRLRARHWRFFTFLWSPPHRQSFSARVARSYQEHVCYVFCLAVEVAPESTHAPWMCKWQNIGFVSPARMCGSRQEWVV